MIANPSTDREGRAFHLRSTSAARRCARCVPGVGTGGRRSVEPGTGVIACSATSSISSVCGST
jgi:hypothetical protein